MDSWVSFARGSPKRYLTSHARRDEYRRNFTKIGFVERSVSIRRAQAKNHLIHSQSGASTCQACGSKRVITFAGERYARARPCPDCSSDCDHCHNTGFVFMENAIGSIDSVSCPRCAPLRRKILLFNQAQLPRRYANTELKNVEFQHNASLTEVIIAFRSIQKTFMPGDMGIGLSGDVGLGKTMIMAAFVRYMTMDREIPCRFVEFSHLLSDIRAGYTAGKADAEIISGLTDVPILIIDELGKALKTEWQVAILDELISRRYNRGVSTFFTTNFPFEAPIRTGNEAAHDDFKVASLRERIASRMYSRLTSMCAFYTITGTDRRTR